MMKGKDEKRRRDFEFIVRFCLRLAKGTRIGENFEITTTLIVADEFWDLSVNLDAFSVHLVLRGRINGRNHDPLAVAIDDRIRDGFIGGDLKGTRKTTHHTRDKSGDTFAFKTTIDEFAIA